MGTHGIDFVDDDDLDGHDFIFVDLPDGAWIFYKESTLTPVSLEDSWAAYRALIGEQPDPDGGEGSQHQAPLAFPGRPEIEAMAPRRPEREVHLRVI